MTDESATGGPATNGRYGLADLPGLGRRIALTRLSLAFEGLWPTAAAILCLAGLYVAAALTEIWPHVPVALHWLAAAACLGGAGAFLIGGLRGFHWPTRAEALRRMEEASGLRHRPLTSLADRRAGLAGARGSADALWAHHRARLRDAAAAARAAGPRSALPRTDCYALRAAAGLVVAAALVHAGRDAPARLADHLLPGATFAAPASIAYDAWIAPPVYTGVADLFLNRLGDTQAPASVAVPAGSILAARVYGAAGAAVRVGETRAELEPKAGAHEIAMPLETGGSLRLTAGSLTLASAEITLIPDEAPQISFSDGAAVSVTAQLSLAVSYDLYDDYGITRAELRLALPEGPDRETAEARHSGEAAAALGAVAALDPPVFRLPLPSLRVRDAEDELAYLDLTAHPWAGLEVAATLAAFDDADQEGLSATRIVRLPERRFTDPVARAVIEQRRKLARAPDAAAEVARALSGLTLHAERFYGSASDYLPLRAAYWRLRNASHPDDLAGIYDLLWNIALHFEDGGLSLAEARLRDAQDAVMDALARDAGPEEIERLMAELRQAMEAFLDALGEQQMQAGEDGRSMPADPDMQSIERGDLERLLDTLQDLAQSGSQEAARQLLAQMRAILENLTAAGPGEGQMTPPQSAMNEAIEGMGDLIDRQRALQDETVQEDSAQAAGPPGSRQPGEDGTQGQGGGTGQAGALGRRQGALRDRLGELRQGLEGTGVPAPSALDRAERAMREAERALEDGDLGGAAQRQGEAIENLRESAQALAESLLEDLAQTGDPRAPGSSSGPEGRDPLGRPQRTAGPQHGEGVEVPDETDIQRARRILDELQRRAADRSRPPIELDYLNRLLQRF